MAIVFLEKQRWQKNLIYVFLIILAVTGIVIWKGFFQKEKESLVKNSLAVQPKKVDINWGVLRDPVLGTLQPFEGFPPFSSSTAAVGRDNPFIAY